MSNRQFDLSRVHPPGAALPTAGAGPELEFVYTPPVHNSQNKPMSARLLYVTAAKYESDWHSIVHSHPFSELFYVLGGKGKFLAGGVSFDVVPDDLIIINSQVPHTEYSFDANPLEYMVLGIDGLSFESGDPNRSAYTLSSSYYQREQIRFYLEALLNEVQQDHPGREAMCQNLLNILLIHILRQEALNLSIASAKSASKECTGVRRYIDAHFKEPITLDDLAKQAHLNKYYLAHAFKNAYGLSPINYLLEKRIEESKHLLSNTDYSLTQIAEIVGFSSASYFSQSFKRATRTAPKEYRRWARHARSEEKSK